MYQTTIQKFIFNCLQCQKVSEVYVLTFCGRNDEQVLNYHKIWNYSIILQTNLLKIEV